MNETIAGDRPAEGRVLAPDLEGLLDELVRDWRSGTPRPLRAYLDRRPGLTGRSEAIVELVNQEIVLRQMQGETPRPSDYLAEFPELTESLERLFEVHDLASDRSDRAGGRMIRSPSFGPFVPPPTGARLPEIPGYEIERVLGRGGMGVVYLARHQGLGRRVALKRLQESRQDDPGLVARFRREAAAAARCQHPNLVQIHDIGEHAGELYLALEYVAGGHLGRKLAGEPQPPREAAELVETLARAIDHAHAQGVVHRDLKPANVLLTDDGQPKITDFGLAKLKDGATDTEVGTVLGTLAYMSPEQVQARSGEIGPRTDIHALGAILYEALTGRPPYRASTPQQVFHAILSEEVVPPSGRRPGVPRDLEAICLKCLEKEPSRRYETAADLAEDLRRFLDARPTLARPSSAAERCVRWYRRNPRLAAVSTLLAATVLAAVSVVFGLTYRYNSGLRAEIARTHARAAEARRNYQEARATVQAMLDRLDARRLDGAPQFIQLCREQREDASAFYDRILSQVDSNDPVVRVDTARALSEASVLQSRLGHVDAGEKSVRRALALIEGVKAPGADPLEPLGIEAKALMRLGYYLIDRKQYEPAIDVGRRSVEQAGRLASATPADMTRQELLALCLNQYASAFWFARLLPGDEGQRSGRIAEAITHYQRAIRIREALDPKVLPGLMQRLCQSYTNLGQVYWNLGRAPEADRAFRRAETVLFSGTPQVLGAGDNFDIDAASLYLNWSGMLLTSGGFDDAIAKAKAGLGRIEPYLRGVPEDPLARRVCVGLHGNRALALTGKEEYEESVREWEQVIKWSDGVIPARSRLDFAIALAYAGQRERAVGYAREVTPGEGVPVGDRYNLACLYSICATHARRDRGLPPEQREARAKSLVAEAMRWLEATAEEGLFDSPAEREHARVDRDLAILREQDGFRRLLESREAKGSHDKPRPPAGR